MDDLLERFKQLLAGSGSSPADGGCELFLAQQPPPLARCFRLCAIPHQFDKPLLTILLPESTDGETEAFFESLSKMSLVIMRGDGLALHDSARTYLFNSWLEQDNPEFRDASRRLQKHFDNRLRETSGQQQVDPLRQRMFHWLGADFPAGIAEFERLFRECRHIGRTSDCASLITLVHEYDKILHGEDAMRVKYQEAKLSADRHDWTAAEDHFRAIAASADVSETLRMKAHNRLGLLHLAQRKWDEAIASLEEAERIAQRLGSPIEQPLILHDLAVAYREKGDRERSQKLLERSTQLAQEKGDVLCLARNYNSLGTLHRSYHEYREAIVAYDRALGYLASDAYKLHRAKLYNNLGDVYYALSDWPNSRQNFNLSLEISKEAADTAGQALALTNLVPVYRASNQIDDAVAAGRTAANYFVALHDYYSAGVAMLRTAKAYRAAKRKPDAIEAYNNAIELFTKAGDNKELGSATTERNELQKPPGLPWWAWASVIFFLLVGVFVIALIVWTARS